MKGLIFQGDYCSLAPLIFQWEQGSNNFEFFFTYIWNKGNQQFHALFYHNTQYCKNYLLQDSMGKLQVVPIFLMPAVFHLLSISSYMSHIMLCLEWHEVLLLSVGHWLSTKLCISVYTLHFNIFWVYIVLNIITV